MFDSVTYTYDISYHEIQYATQVISYLNKMAQVSEIKSRFMLVSDVVCLWACPVT
jgi:hypothetical protein